MLDVSSWNAAAEREFPRLVAGEPIARVLPRLADSIGDALASTDAEVSLNGQNARVIRVAHARLVLFDDALRESEEKYRTLVDNSPVVLWTASDRARSSCRNARSK